MRTMGEVTDRGSSKSPSSLKSASFAELLRARNTLQTALERSRGLEDDLARAGPRLQRIAMRIPSLEADFAPLRSHRKVLDDLAGNIEKAVGPATALLKVFDAVHGLERSLLSDPKNDLVGYIGLISRLEEASNFLSDNCSMAIEWLQEMVEFLDRNQVLNDDPMKRILSHLKALKNWQASGDRTKLDGGLHAAALDRLEAELQRILSKEGSPELPASAVAEKNDATKPAARLPAQTIRCLHIIIEKLAAHGRRQKCMDLFIETRIKVAKSSLRSLQLEYLQLASTESSTKLGWRSLEMYVGPWTQHMEVIVRSLFEPEYQLCSQALEQFGYEVWEECFGRIAAAGGMMYFLQFGEVAARTRDEPQKLFKLLDMFEAMNNLRPSFAKIFGGTGCKEVQQRTRDLLKLVVQGAHDIFMELRQQVEKQKEVEPPMDGSVPRVSSFVVSYVKHLVGDFYGPIITEVLAIRHSWTDESAGKKTEEGLLSQAVRSIMKALVFNFHEWAKRFQQEPALFHLFLTTNYWYLYVNCKAPELRSVLGDSWLREQQQQAEHHATLYVKDGWARVTQHLSIPGVTTLTGSRAAARDLLKTRLKAFNSAFEDLHQKHSKWVIPDLELREKTCTKVVKAIVPAYRTYLQSYGPLIEQDGSQGKHAKYSAQGLERILGSLFKGRPEKILGGSEKTINGSTAITRTAVVSVI